MTRLLAAVALAVIVGLSVGPGAAQATRECKGLQVCVRVAGPWVVVPSAPRVPRAQAEYQLACPKKYIVGGLDAELSDRHVDVSFLGKLGSPVNPGITTSSSAVFVATFTGSSARAVTFRPHLGCVPTSGGGGGPVPYLNPASLAAAAAAAPPTSTATWRSHQTRLRPRASQKVTQACGRGERYLAGWGATGFYTAKPPAASLVASVVSRVTAGHARTTASVRSGTAISGVRAVVQAGAVCGGGS
jgi:hypothetical protein